MISLLDLPNELLLEIMEHCKTTSILSLSETCKRFNKLVFRNSRFMNQFTLFLGFLYKKPSLDILMKSKRKYSKIKIGLMFYQQKEVYSAIIKKFGEHVTNIKFWKTEIVLDDLKNILDCCPNIQKINMYGSYSTCEIQKEYRRMDLPKLEKLKILEMNGSELKFLKILINAQLTDLSVKLEDDDEYYYVDIAYFINFFQTQQNMESFKLENNNVLKILIALDFSKKLNSQLKKLEMINHDFCCLDKITNKVSDCLEQTNLEELHIMGVNSLTAAEYDHLLSKNPKLKTLTLDIKYYKSNNRHCTSVKNLKLMYENNSRSRISEEEEARRYRINDLVTEFPNVEVLELNRVPNLDHSTFKSIADSMVNLTKLTITVVCHEQMWTMGNVKFPSLKSLHLHGVLNFLTDKGFQSFLENNKQINILEITFCHNFMDSTMQLIVDNLKDLETFHLNCFKMLNANNTLTMIAENLKKLKLLKIERGNKKFKKSNLAPLNSIPGLKVFADVIDDDRPSSPFKKCKYE